MKEHLLEIGKLANMLNSNAAQLLNAKDDLDRAITRIEATKRSLLVIQCGIFEELRKVKNETKSVAKR